MVSYGIYMLHMPVVHATSFLFMKTQWWRGNPVAYVIAYWGIALLGTVTVALLSYRFYETPFLNLKDRRFVAVPASTPCLGIVTPHRLLYLCDWLPPDFGAVGQYSVQFARERARAGEWVTLGGLSSTADSVTEESVGAGQLRVVRVHRATYDRARLLHRALWTLGTNLRLIRRLWRALREADEVLFTGSPPFLLHFLVPLNLLLRKRLDLPDHRLSPRVFDRRAGRAGQAQSGVVGLALVDDRAAAAGGSVRGAGRGPAAPAGRDRHRAATDPPQARPVAGGDRARHRAARTARGAGGEVRPALFRQLWRRARRQDVHRGLRAPPSRRDGAGRALAERDRGQGRRGRERGS